LKCPRCDFDATAGSLCSRCGAMVKEPDTAAGLAQQVGLTKQKQAPPSSESLTVSPAGSQPAFQSGDSAWSDEPAKAEAPWLPPATDSHPPASRPGRRLTRKRGLVALVTSAFTFAAVLGIVVVSLPSSPTHSSVTVNNAADELTPATDVPLASDSATQSPATDVEPTPDYSAPDSSTSDYSTPEASDSPSGCSVDGCTATAKTASDERVWIRPEPNTSQDHVAGVNVGDTVQVTCYVSGETESGPNGTSDQWDRTQDGSGYISDPFLDVDGTLEPCA
jgi:hypothetical protein